MSQSEDENYNNNHYKNRTGIDSSSINTSKQLLLKKKAIFKMVLENKCEDGKTSSRKTRFKSSNEMAIFHVFQTYNK